MQLGHQLNRTADRTTQTSGKNTSCQGQQIKLEETTTLSLGAVCALSLLLLLTSRDR